MDGLLDKMKTSLEEIAENNDVPMEAVYYGIMNDSEVENWNYIVFNRVSTTRRSGASYNEKLQVNLIHEDYIPEGYEMDVMKKVCEDCNLRMADGVDIAFNYSMKPNTRQVVEIATITLVRVNKMKVI